MYISGHKWHLALSFLISKFCEQNFTFLKTTRKRNHFLYFGYGQLVIEYLISGKIKCSVLRVFRADVRRIRNHSPSLSCVLIRSQWLFRARAVLWNEPEHRNQRTREYTGRFFFLTINTSYARQLIDKVWRFPFTDGGVCNNWKRLYWCHCRGWSGNNHSSIDDA